jgi:hypothetical protein
MENWEECTRTSDTQTCILVPICRWHFCHLALWPRKADGVSEPPHWISCKHLVQSGKRRPPSVSGYWHLHETGRLPRSQSLSEAHPYQSLYTLRFTSPTCEQTNSPGFPDTKSHSSLWLGLPYSRIGISHDRLKGKWLQPSADTSPELCNTDYQDQRKTHLNSIYTLHPNNIRLTQQNDG